MSPRISSPNIDPRKANDLLRLLREMAPHYTKEWSAKDDDDPGVALLKIYSFIAEGVISRLNRAPDRNFLAFLDMLGIRLLQARPARAPVTFLVAKGTEIPFLVPKGTQVSAPPTEQHTEDLPFETLKNLLVVPSVLTSLIAVDPETDKIFQPPPGFLELSSAATPLPELTVKAFSAVKSKNLQLDPPEQVKKGDFLRIDQKVTQRSGPDQCVPIEEVKESIQSEHLVVADVKGSVVTVTDPLSRDYVDGTTVQKVTQFELFEARNWQEHILYLAHSEYFAIKSEAEITLSVRLASPGSSLQLLQVAWEFFTEIEATKEKAWLPLELDGDGTQGFSRDGDVLLTKPEGEIKETEINGQKNRWIRARLDEPLPLKTVLPKIESIMLKVSHKGTSLTPDKAFNNDTPLTTAAPFFPFGIESRIFDRFSIASDEAFSKPGAEVTLDFRMDTTDLLAIPDAVVIADKIRAFARGVGGKLLEFKIDPRDSRAATTTTINHDTPDNTVVASKARPAVVRNNAGDHVGVFVRAEDGKIYVRDLVGTNVGTWNPLTVPPGNLDFDPAVVLSGGQWQVFVVADQRLYSQTLNPDALSFGNTWTLQSAGPVIDSAPFVMDVAGQVAVLVTDESGRVWKSISNVWTDLTTTLNLPPDFRAAAKARPGAVAVPGPLTRIFWTTENGELVEVDSAGGQFNHATPASGMKVSSNPFALTSTGTHVYVRANDNRLWSFEDPSGSWVEHGHPSQVILDGDPLALAIPENGEELFSVLSTGDKNSLLELRLRGKELDHGILQAGPLSVVAIDDDLTALTPSLTLPLFIYMVNGPNAKQACKMNMTLSKQKLAVVEDPPFTDPVEKDNEYKLLDKQKDQAVVSATRTTLELQPTAGALMGDFVLVNDQIREIRNISGDVVTVDSWVGPLPTSTDNYLLLRPVGAPNKKALVASLNLAVLAASASGSNNAYDRRYLVITNGDGKHPVGLEIETYFGVTQHVQLSEKFQAGIPKKGSEYLVTATKVAENWLQYEDPDHADLRPELSWEYGNGLGWLALSLQNDGTDRLLKPGFVIFTIPKDIAETEVAGQKGFWIRSRLVSGDYGHDIFKFDQVTNQITIEKNPIKPPKINTLFISYRLVEEKEPQLCLTLNNLNYLDQTAANITENKNFHPYVPLSDQGKALYFGFDRAFQGAPVRLYLAAKELAVDERDKPKLVWSFAFENDWKELIAEDGTDGFTKPDFVTLDVPDGFQDSQQFGQTLYWLRASLVEGDWVKSPLFSGVFSNTVEALQVGTVRDEILGSSTGVKNQKFNFVKTPVIEGEEVRVREALTEQEREDLISAQGKESVFAITDQQDRVLETWIRWTEVPEFFDSVSTSRNYRLDRHTGEIEFGDGTQGRIPPAGGDNIRAFVYQAGGGAAGNVKAGEINSPVTAVAGVDSVINPVSAGGGSDAATNEDMLTVSPAQISHRSRAVTPDDFERLALEASREVRKARCLPNRNANGRHELGWTTVHIVPDSLDAEPIPSLELRRAVQRYLADRADLTLVDQKHIVVGPPEYVPVTVVATVIAKSIDDVATADQRVKKQLEAFLNPLKGGPDKEGWEFGRDLAASDLYSLLEEIEEVDHIESLRLFIGDSESGEQVAVGADALIASGTHKITTAVQVENR